MAVSERVSLVEAVEGDAERLAEISKRAFDSDVDVGAPGPGGPPGYDSPEFHVRVMRYFDCYNILLDDEMVGGLMVAPNSQEHHVIERVFVDPEHHNSGIATRATEMLWDLYPGVKLWTLGTPEWNARTEHFYEKFGFVQVGWDRGDPKWRGRWYERVMDPSDPYEMAKIGNLSDGMRNVDAEGEILEKAVARLVRSRRGETLSVANTGFGDDSGRIVLVLWNEQIKQAKVGDRVRVENGYVNSYRGVNQLNVGRAGRLIILL